MSELESLKLDGLSQTIVVGKRSGFRRLSSRLLITDRGELANALRPFTGARGADLPRLLQFYRRVSRSRKLPETDDFAGQLAAAFLAAGYCAVRVPKDAGGGELPIELARDIKPLEANSVHNARPEDKYARVLEMVPQYLPGEMRGAFAELVSPAAIGTTVAILVLWAGSHALGVGFAIDVLLLAIGFAMVGWSIFGAVGDVIDFFEIMESARNDADLNRAARKLAGAIAALGVGAFIALLTRGAGRIAAAKKASVPRKSSSSGGGGGAAASDAQLGKYQPKTEDTRRRRKQTKRDDAQQATDAVPPLRQEYEDKVRALSDKANEMRDAGKSREEIARALHADRRALGVEYKDLTPPDKLEEIYARNQKKYGDKLGPSIEYLRGKGKTWDDIIESASRPGGKDLKF